MGEGEDYGRSRGTVRRYGSWDTESHSTTYFCEMCSDVFRSLPIASGGKGDIDFADFVVELINQTLSWGLTSRSQNFQMTG